MTQAPDELKVIVRWLRDKSKDELARWSSIEGNGCMEWADAWQIAANQIERGGHLSEQGEGYE